MTRPFTEGPTTLMPELHDTRPMAVVKREMFCAWCGIRLAAIPDSPSPLVPPWSKEVHYFHPGGCAAAARGAGRGEGSGTLGADPVAVQPRVR